MKYALDYHVVPIMTLTTVTAAETDTAFVDMKNYQWVDFLVSFGTITGDVITLTVEEATANVSTSSTPIALPFVYRWSSPVGTDSLGAATTCASTGLSVAATDDDTLYVLSMDPSTMTDGYSYLRVAIAEGSSTSASVKGVTAILMPKYAQATALSTT
jgi:hypothetical protein